MGSGRRVKVADVRFRPIADIRVRVRHFGMKRIKAALIATGLAFVGACSAMPQMTGERHVRFVGNLVKQNGKYYVITRTNHLAHQCWDMTHSTIFVVDEQVGFGVSLPNLHEVGRFDEMTGVGIRIDALSRGAVARPDSFETDDLASWADKSVALSRGTVVLATECSGSLLE